MRRPSPSASGKKERQLSDAERAEKARQSSPALQRVEPPATTAHAGGLQPPTTLPARTSTPILNAVRQPQTFIVDDG